eukprot:COSAG03_NODE_441_length_7895_cov_3.758466_1_plen_681_part_00
MDEATSTAAGSGVGSTPAWLAPQGSANTAAWSKLTEEEASKARALGHRHSQGLVALAVLLARCAAEEAEAIQLTLQAHDLTEDCVRAVLRACGADLPGAEQSPELWLSALSIFARTTTAAKWGELENEPARVCAGWRENFEVLEQQPFVVLIAVLKEAVAGPAHWLVRPALTKGCPRALILAHFAPGDMVSIVQKMTRGSEGFNCCVAIMLRSFTQQERRDLGILDLDASSQTASMDGSYAGSKQIKDDIKRNHAFDSIGVDAVLKVFTMLDALLVVAEAVRLRDHCGAEACVAVYGKPARQSRVYQALESILGLKVLDFSHPTLVTRLGIKQKMWVNMLSADPQHMVTMDKRTADFAESVRGRKVSCSFYSGIQARDKNVLGEWVPWHESNQQNLIDMKEFRPNSGKYKGQLVVQMLPTLDVLTTMVGDDPKLGETISLLLSVSWWLKTDDVKAAIGKKRANTYALKTDAEKAAIGKKRANTYALKTDAEKAAIGKKVANAYALKTDAEKEAHRKKFANTIALMTDAEKEARQQKIADTWAKKTAAEIEASQNRAKDTLAEMYTEQGHVKAPPVLMHIGHYVEQVGKNSLIKQRKFDGFRDPKLKEAWAALTKKDRDDNYLKEAKLILKRKREWNTLWEAAPSLGLTREPKKPKNNPKGAGRNMQRKQTLKRRKKNQKP